MSIATGTPEPMTPERLAELREMAAEDDVSGIELDEALDALEAAERERDEARADLSTERELRQSEEESFGNLWKYAQGEDAYAFPMAGLHVSVRDIIKQLRSQLAEARAALEKKDTLVHQALDESRIEHFVSARTLMVEALNAGKVAAVDSLGEKP